MSGRGNERIVLAELINRSGSLLRFSPELTGAEVVRACRESHVQDVYPVVNAERLLLGVITADEIRILSADPALVLLVTASDLMRNPMSLHPGDDLKTALDKMVENAARELPVIDDQGRFEGFIEESAIARAYLKHQRESVSPAQAQEANEERSAAPGG